MANARGTRSSTRQQWVWLVLVVAVVVVVAAVVVPRLTGGTTDTAGRDVVHRRSAADAFPGGLATQPGTANQARGPEQSARSAGDVRTADRIAVIADQPIATWLTGSSAVDTVRTVRQVVDHARDQDRTPTFVLYAVPDRDCGHYSAGGLTPDEYVPWVRRVARALDGSHAVVLVEPDSIAQIENCPRLERDRLPLLHRAVTALGGHGLGVYLDGGNEDRVPVDTMAARLRTAGIDRVQGFFTNVSNFYRVDQERAYADELADRIGGDPHFVIDVSRNGQGWTGTWCNPSGAGLGQLPHVTLGTTRLDALLWVKTPGLSDGTCNGGPTAGTWWEQSALALVANRRR